MTYWTRKGDVLACTYGDFRYEAVADAVGLVYLRSYDMGVTWNILSFNELPHPLQVDLLNAIKS